MSPVWRARVVFFLLVLCAAARAQGRLVLDPGPSLGRVGESLPLLAPSGIVVDAQENIFVADSRGNRIYRIAFTGDCTVIAGTGRQGFLGDGGAATASELNAPTAVALASDGALLVADTGNHRIRRVGAAGVITTIAGNGRGVFSGDGGLATAAGLRSPAGITIAADGRVFISDTGNHRVRVIAVDGTISTVAGNGEEGSDGDGGAATAATLLAPEGLTFLADGRLLIADRAAHRVRALLPDRRLVAYVENSLPLRSPRSLAAAAGSLYVGDASSHRVAEVTADAAGIAVGNGEQGAPRTVDPVLSSLNTPTGVAAGGNGNLYITERGGRRITRVSPALADFGSVPAGTVSSVKTITLHNAGDAPLTVRGVDVPAGFAAEYGGPNCASTAFVLQQGAACTLPVVFQPSAAGAWSGLLQARSNSVPQSLFLSGNATARGSLAPSTTTLNSAGSLSYTGVPVTVAVAVNGGLRQVPTGSVTFIEDSTPVGHADLTNGAASVIMTSLATGTHSLRATYGGDASYASSSSAPVTLQVIASPDFAASIDGGSFTATPGSTVTIPFTLLPTNGTLGSAVTLVASGLPAGSVATFSPSTATLKADPLNFTLTVKLPATIAANEQHGGVLATLLCASLGLVCARRRARVRRLALLALCVVTFAGCGGGVRTSTGSTSSTSSTSAPKTFTPAITATVQSNSGQTIVHTLNFTLTVTQ